MNTHQKIQELFQKIIKTDNPVSEIESLLEFDKQDLEMVSTLLNDLQYDKLAGKLSDYTNSLEQAYKDGEIIFSDTKQVKGKFWGSPFYYCEAGTEETDFLENINKLKI